MTIRTFTSDENWLASMAANILQNDFFNERPIKAIKIFVLNTTNATLERLITIHFFFLIDYKKHLQTNLKLFKFSHFCFFFYLFLFFFLAVSALYIHRWFILLKRTLIRDIPISLKFDEYV